MSEQFRDIQIPLDLENLGGPFLTTKAAILAEKNGRGIASIEELDEGEASWLDEFDWVYFHTLRDGVTLKAIRKATDEEIKSYRVPVWIQEPKIPRCCGRPMRFVGQIDDGQICTEPPADAKMWWHDVASFYVFTCSQCLGVQAVGQQF